MQIHEVTQRSGGFGSAVGDELETLAFGSPLTKRQEPKADQYALARSTGKAKQAAAANTTQAQMKTPPAGTVPSARLNSPTADPAQLPKPAVAPNFIQTNRVKYQPATVNAPVATVPNVSNRPTIAGPAAQNQINPAAAPVVYSLDGRPLNPNNPVHAKLIAQLQSAGLTKANAKTRAIKR